MKPVASAECPIGTRVGNFRRHTLSPLLVAVMASLTPTFADDIFLDGFEFGTLCAWSYPPAGFEVDGNGLDDDCDDAIDEVATICDGGLPSNSSNAAEYAAAMGICQGATETGHDWGLISSSLTLASGSGTPAAASRSIRLTLGGGISPREGNSMAVLSSGTAAAPGQVSPAHLEFQVGQDTGTSSDAPADWLAANGGVFPTLAGCPDAESATARNPVMLNLRVRVPGNARSLRMSAHFLGADYPEWVCSPFNDIFVALLDSQHAGTPANPADKNLAAHGTLPLSVNLALGNTGLFTQCLNGPTGCASSAVKNNSIGCTTTAGLAGTGMDVTNPPALPNEPGWCGASNLSGGGTGWLEVRGNVQPGENIDLRLAIWDTGDNRYDSVILLDNFQWSLNHVEPGATAE